MAKAALEKHAEDVVVMDLRPVSSVADFFVIASAASHRQMSAITEHITEQLKRAGRRVWHVEGLVPPEGRGSTRVETSALEPMGELSWVLMDCGELVVHLFNPPARHFYQLERLWGDAPRLSLEAVLSG